MWLILILMFFLACLQLPWALIQGIASRNPNVRRHFGYYGLGVIAYFAILLPFWGGLNHLEDNQLTLIHFFAGAWGLAFYHIWIVNLSVIERKVVQLTGEDPFVGTEAEV